MSFEIEQPVDDAKAWAWQLSAAAIWMAALGISFVAVMAYKSMPGSAAQAPISWPANAALARPSDHKLLILFAHPRCPCTRATLHELQSIVAAVPAGVVRVVMFRPHDYDQSWVDSDTCQQARAMPGVELVWDDEGRIAAQFGAHTSGQVMIYDERGHLTFSGGITAIRGHAGWNSNAASARAHFRGEESTLIESPVYGCPLTHTTTLDSDQEKPRLP